MKTCTKCKLEKPLEAFSKSTQRKSGYLNSCKECDNKKKQANNAALRELDPEAYLQKRRDYFQTYKQRHPDKIKDADRRRSLMAKYGITPEEYDTLLEAQGGTCAVCPATPGRKSLAVDHDHNCCPGQKTCGKCIRGLLCQNCNTALGLLGDEKERIMNLIKYLERT